MDPKNVTFIIPAFNLKKHRIQNLRFIIPYILNTGCRTLVVEQVNGDISNLSELMLEFPTAEHILFKTDEQRFHKTGLINWAVYNYVNTKYAWVNDVDFYMRFSDPLSVKWKSPFIQPYIFAKKLSEKTTNKLLVGRPINVNYAEKSAQYISMYSALSFIFDVSEFKKIGGMDISIYRLGKEDEEFAHRVKSEYVIQKFKFKGIHLYHPIDRYKKIKEIEQKLTIEPIPASEPIFEPIPESTCTSLPEQIPQPTPELTQEIISTIIPSIEEIDNSYKSASDLINHYFDKVYCVNLDHRKDRWKRMAALFHKFDIKVQRYSAVNGSILQDLDNISKYELGCLKSHLDIIKDAKVNNFQRVLIFEDDIFLSKNFEDRILEIQHLDWKLMYLGCSQLDWTGIDIVENKYLSKNSLGTFAYAVDHSIYDILIEKFEKQNKPVDMLLAEVQEEYTGDCITLFPNIVISDVRSSDIRTSIDIFHYANMVKWDINSFYIFTRWRDNNFSVLEKKPKKVLLVPDTRNWAFDNIAKAIKKYNPDQSVIEYDIAYVKEIRSGKTGINPKEWDLIYVMFEGERIIPDAKNVVRGCYSAHWIEQPELTPEYMSKYFSECLAGIFVNPELMRQFLPYLPEDFPTEVIYDASDENIFYKTSDNKYEEFTALYVGNTKRPIKNFDKIVNICNAAGVQLKVCQSVSPDMLVHEYNRADILINYSTFEGGPQTFVEASLCKVPTLIRDINELAKHIPCFTGHDENEFISKLKYLKNNRNECIMMGKNAYDVAIGNFTYKKAAEKFFNFFDLLIKIQ